MTQLSWHPEFNNKKLLLSIVLFIISTQLFSQLRAPADFYHYRNAQLNTEAELFWKDKNDDESGYVIEQKYDGDSWTVAAALPENTTHYTISSLDPARSIEFRIKAVKEDQNSTYTGPLRLVGTSASLEVYPEVPGIRDPVDTTVNGKTFGIIQDQCPAEPDKGKATRISTFYRVQVRTLFGDFKESPVYETRPQIRNNFPQNDPRHSGGHRPYGYQNYGPSSTDKSKKMHSRHWTNFDASENVVVRVTLKGSGNFSGPIKMSDLKIYPLPIELSQASDSVIEMTLAPGPDYTTHYRVGINRRAWSLEGGRGENTTEAPLLIFINPIHIAPASAPENSIKEFNNGSLVVFGPGIHLPNNNYRFFGAGGNATCRELYAPGDAYLHYGFIFNNSYGMKVWGRAIYSDELFDVYLSSKDYDWSDPDRTPWAHLDCTAGNPWGKDPQWEGRAGFYYFSTSPTIFEGFTNIGTRMGVVNNGGNAELLNHKDVGYGGSTYQGGYTGHIKYKGCLLVNDDDITYTHADFEMDHCTSFNLRNGPSFQFGWAVNIMPDARGHITNHIALSSDRASGIGYGKNHGVFNSRLKLGDLKYHYGGTWENMDVYGEENIVFHIRIWDESDEANKTSYFGDKVFRSINIHKKARNRNKIWGDQDETSNLKSFIHFLHFDSLVIEGKQIINIDDGNHFEYNEAALLHTITFFSLPPEATVPKPGLAPVGEEISLTSEKFQKMIGPDLVLPASYGPLCANMNNAFNFELVDAGDGYVALKTPYGYYVKADPERYGYIYCIPDEIRGDPDIKDITEEAKFIWKDLDDHQFALYSKSMKRYVRVEGNCGPELPLYAASAEIGEAETFSRSPLDTEESLYHSQQINIFPNPAHQELNIDGLKINQRLDLLSVDGKFLGSYDSNGSTMKLDLKHLLPGIYLLRLVSGNDLTTIQFLVE